MPRAWGYIVIMAVVLIGVGALMIPIPQTVEITPEKESGFQDPAPSAAARRPGRPASKATPPPPAVKAVPKQDTTKSRLLVQPSQKKP